MTTSVTNAETIAEREKAFEEWLVAALESGRAQLRARRAAPVPVSAAIAPSLPQAKAADLQTR